MMYLALQGSTPNLIKDLIQRVNGREENGQLNRLGRNGGRGTNKKLKKIAFQVLLFGSRLVTDDAKDLSPVDRMLAVVFTFRSQLKFNEANQLEASLFKLQRSNALVNDDIRNVISLMLLLANEGTEKEDCLGCVSPTWQPPLPPFFSPIIPQGPMAYSPTKICNQNNDFYYTHYPKELFEKPGPDLSLNISSMWTIDSKLFEMAPGTQRFVSLPSQVTKQPTSYVQQFTHTLYGTLTRQPSDLANMDIRLEIPELGDTSPLTSLSSHFCASQSSEDEGFIEVESPVSGCGNAILKSPDIWEAVLSMEPRTHYTWEDLGRLEVCKEKFYLTESGEMCMNEMEALWQQQLLLLHPRLQFPAWTKKTTEELLRDISYVMLGISSQCFTFVESRNCFSVADNICVVGWSHLGLTKFLAEFANCGTFYLRLRNFSAEPAHGSANFSQGLVFRAFTRGIRRTLHYYHALVLTVRPRTTLVQFSVATRKMRLQLENLADLCRCNDSTHSVDPNSQFPNGMQLLTYLYENVVTAVGSDFYLVVLSLLSTTCVPYLKFLHGWIYNGLCLDPYDEFPIKLSEQYMAYRDHRYWTKGFRLSPQSSNQAADWPLISEKLMTEVHVCGKGVNLLKLCAPQHHLCSGGGADGTVAPPLQLLFSHSELETTRWKSAEYVTSMESMRKDQRRSWEDVQRQEEENRRVLREEAVRGAAETMQRMEKQILDAREAKQAEKRRQMSCLQAQIRDVREQRRLEKERKDSEESVDHGPVTVVDEEANDECVEPPSSTGQLSIGHYESLNAHAELRERRAQWRFLRQRLSTARIEFLEQERRQTTLSLAALHTRGRRSCATAGSVSQGNLEVPGQQPMQTSPDFVYTPGSHMSDSLDSFETNSVFDSPSTVAFVMKETDNEIIVMGNEQNETGTTELEENANNVANNSAREADRNANTIRNKMPAANVAKRPDILSLDSSGASTKLHKFLPPPPPSTCVILRRQKSKHSDSSGIVADAGDLLDKSIEQINTVSPNSKMNFTQGGVPKKNLPDGTTSRSFRFSSASSTKSGDSSENDNVGYTGRHLVMRLTSEESSGRDSGIMSLATPASEDDNAQMMVSVETPASIANSSDSLISSVALSSSYNDDVMGDYGAGLALVNAGTVVRSRGRNDHGHASDSTLQELMYPASKSQAVVTGAGNVSTTGTVPEMSLTMTDGREASELMHPRRRNVYGHASDSTIQTMMYGEKAVSAPATPLEENDRMGPRPLLQRSKSVVTPYTQHFNIGAEFGLADMMSQLGGRGDDGGRKDVAEDEAIHEMFPLEVFVQRSLVAPLMSQISLVKKGLYDFYMVDLGILEHLEILRYFFLLHDGEFAQALADILFEKMTVGTHPAELLNPVTLNGILNKSLNASLHREHPLTGNLSFVVHTIPHVFPLHVAAPFDGLELQYKVSWPVNVVISSSSLVKYNKLFRFLMQIRHALWALTDVFYHLKRSVRHQSSLSSCLQFKQLQLFRHEMHHFVRVLHAYVANQVLQVSWEELKADITSASDAHSLDHLHEMHAKYVNRCLYRCLLLRKAAPVMRVVQMIFAIILKFHAQMVALPWKLNADSGNFEHPGYAKLVASYRIFREYSGFLYKAWLHDAVGTLSDNEIGNARVPAALERILAEIQLQ